MSGGGVIHVAARFVRFGFQGKFQVIFLVQHVIAQEVHSFPVALDGRQRALGGICFRTFPPAPEDIHLGTKLRTQVNRLHGFLDGIGAHFGIVGCERAILEDWIIKQVGCSHGNLKAGRFQCLAEILLDLVCFGRRCINRDQVVIVEVDAVRADLPQQVHQLCRSFGLAHLGAKRVAADGSNRP